MGFVRSVCPHDCPSTCALEVETLDARTIGKVRGNAANDYTMGVICAKVARYAERLHHPDRLTKPLRRVGPKAGPGGRNRFEPCSWNDAIDTVAEGLLKATERHGPTAVWPYFFAGTMGLVQRDCIHRLRHVFGYSREDETICVSLAQAGWLAGNGAVWGADPREMVESDMIVIWGCNAVATQVNVMTHVARARKARGAKLVVVDTYRNGTVEAADVGLILRPGTDGALACAVMHVLFKEGYADRDYMARYADVPDELEKHLADKTPAWAAAITGLTEQEIVDFARMYGRTKKTFLRIGYGFTRQRNGAAAMHAVSCLPVVTGSWKYKGGGALYTNAQIYAAADQTTIKALDRMDPSIRALDMCQIGPILMGEKDALLGGPPVDALFIQNINPMVVVPDLKKVHAGFAREDLFVCVHEQFMTETAAVADVVLPATMFPEHDDIYRSGGHVYLQVSKKIVEPLGECRSNNDVICALGKRLGSDYPGFHMTEWELIDDMLKRSGFPGAEEVYAMGGVDCAKPFEEMHFLNGFKTPDGKFRFAPDWKALGPTDPETMPRLPDHLGIIEKATDDHPFRLVGAPARQFLNTSFTETPTSVKREGRPTAMIHPNDCARLGIADGQRVRLGNRRADIVLYAKAFDGVQPGVVIVESIWPNASFEEGLSLNALMGSDRPPPRGGGAFHDTAVWIRPA